MSFCEFGYSADIHNSVYQRSSN